MKCPYCNTEMLLGYLHAPNMIWCEKESKIALSPGKNEKYALYLKLPLLTSNRVESYCCSICKRIIIDVSAYPHSLE